MRWLVLSRRYRITHLCGHRRLHWLEGSKARCRRRALSLSFSACPRCARLHADNPAPPLTAPVLPPLIGPKRDLPHAVGIRRRLLGEADALLASSQLQRHPLAQAVLGEIRAQTDTGWWLAHAPCSARQLFSERLRGRLASVSTPMGCS